MNIFTRTHFATDEWQVIHETDAWGQPTARPVRHIGPSPLPTPGHGKICERRAGHELENHREQPEDPGAPTRIRLAMRPFQLPVFKDRTSGILVLHWSRQIGKSFVLAAWAVDRLLTRPGRLVTVLSNSRENGAEFVAKCAEVCRLNGTEYVSKDKSRGVRFQNMRMEIRVRSHGQVGRIKVLAANPRTARGFSGDLILDEFAFHEDSAAIWEAAEPILASNADYLCRIASTGNGRHNLFHRMTAHTPSTLVWIPNPHLNRNLPLNLNPAEFGVHASACPAPAPAAL